MTTRSRWVLAAGSSQGRGRAGQFSATAEQGGGDRGYLVGGGRSGGAPLVVMVQAADLG